MSKLASANYQFETIDQIGDVDRNRHHRTTAGRLATINAHQQSYSRYPQTSGTIDYLNSINTISIHRSYDNPLIVNTVPGLSLYPLGGTTRSSLSPTRLPPPVSFSPPYHIYPNNPIPYSPIRSQYPTRTSFQPRLVGPQYMYRAGDPATPPSTRLNNLNPQVQTVYMGTTSSPLRREYHSHANLNGSRVNDHQTVLNVYSDLNKDVCGLCELNNGPKGGLQDAWAQKQQRLQEQQKRRVDMEAEIAAEERKRIQKQNNSIIEESRRQIDSKLSHMKKQTLQAYTFTNTNNQIREEDQQYLQESRGDLNDSHVPSDKQQSDQLIGENHSNEQSQLEQSADKSLSAIESPPKKQAGVFGGGLIQAQQFGKKLIHAADNTRQFNRDRDEIESLMARQEEFLRGIDGAGNTDGFTEQDRLLTLQLKNQMKEMNDDVSNKFKQSSSDVNSLKQFIDRQVRDIQDTIFFNGFDKLEQKVRAN